MAKEITNLIHEFYKIISDKNLNQIALPTSWVVFFKLPFVLPGGAPGAGGGYSDANLVQVERIKDREPDGVVHMGGTTWDGISDMIPQITTSIKSQTYGWLPAQQVNIPGDSYNVSPQGDFSIGWGKGQVGKGRAPWQQLTVDFYEINGSVVDYILRPWLVMAAHNSLKIAHVKSSVHVLPLMKQLYPNNQNSPRKIFSFFNCVPTTIGGEVLSHSAGGPLTKSVSFTYDYYSVTKPTEDFFANPNPVNTSQFDLGDIL